MWLLEIVFKDDALDIHPARVEDDVSTTLVINSRLFGLVFGGRKRKQDGR